MCKPFLENFFRFEQLAVESENKEINTHRNSAWKSAKQDGKKNVRIDRLEGKS